MKILFRTPGALLFPNTAPRAEPTLAASHRRTEAFERFSIELAQMPDVLCWRRPVGHDAQGVATTNVPWQLMIHSPTGFEWGYQGSGPADFALNILALVLPPWWAWRYHQHFKREVVAMIPIEGGLLPIDGIRQWVLERREADDVDEAAEEEFVRLRREAAIEGRLTEEVPQ